MARPNQVSTVMQMAEKILTQGRCIETVETINFYC